MPACAVFAYTHSVANIQAFVHTYTCIGIHVCMYMCVCVCVYACTRVHMCDLMNNIQLSLPITLLLVLGDNILTAVSVAHQCGMIRPKEKVVMVNAYPPDNAAPAKIEWELANTETSDELIQPRSDESEETSSDKNVRIG